VAGMGIEANLDDFDFWYRARFVAPARAYALRFGGLATFAEAWLDDKPLLSSENMFLSHEPLIHDSLARPVELSVRFRAFRGAVMEHAPRPRWRARSIEPGAIRRARTTLI